MHLIERRISDALMLLKKSYPQRRYCTLFLQGKKRMPEVTELSLPVLQSVTKEKIFNLSFHDTNTVIVEAILNI